MRSRVRVSYGPFIFGSVAQLVEQRIEAPCVGGSIPSRAINLILCGYSLVVKPQPSKLLSRVRFSLPAFTIWAYSSVGLERTPDKREVDGSSPFRPIGELLKLAEEAPLLRV